MFADLPRSVEFQISHLNSKQSWQSPVRLLAKNPSVKSPSSLLASSPLGRSNEKWIDAYYTRWCGLLKPSCRSAKLKPVLVALVIDAPNACNTQVLEICQSYRDTFNSSRTQDIRAVSIDVQTGIQALERTADDLRPRSAMIAHREYGYTRHETLALCRNLYITTSKILSLILCDTRTEVDFLQNMDGLVCLDPKAQWRFMPDS